MLIFSSDIEYTMLQPPVPQWPEAPTDLTDAVYERRLSAVCSVMQAEGLDAMLIYADREHGSNFGYFTGFEPRFEEGCLVIHTDGSCWIMLGNETLKMHQYSRIAVKPVHVPYFSLPNQPMEGDRPLEDVLADAGVQQGKKTGLVGWKLFTSADGKNRRSKPSKCLPDNNPQR